MSNYIQNLVKTAGWKEVKQMFDDAVVELRSEKISDELDGDTYKTTSLGNIKAANKIEKLLNKIELAGASKTENKISYK